MTRMRKPAVIIMLILVIAFTLIATYTTFGRRIYVIGGNSQVAFLSGINVSRTMTGLFILNGLMCGITTLVYCSQLGAAMPQNATGFEFDVITAVVLGGTMSTGGKGNVIGTALASMVIGLMRFGLPLCFKIGMQYLDIPVGMLLLVVVLARALAAKPSFQNLIARRKRR